VALVFVYVNRWVFSLFDAADDELVTRLTILVIDRESAAVVQEGVSSGAHCLSQNEANFILATNLINLCEAASAPEVLCDADEMEIFDVVVGELGNSADLNVGIELAKLLLAGLSPCSIANVLLCDVEVAAQVTNLHLSRIVKRDRFGASKDKILCDFDTETAHTDNENLHLDKLAHGLETKRADLTRVEISINLNFFNHCVFVYL